MNLFKICLITIPFITLTYSSSFSQKGKMEVIKETCKDLPFNKRTIVAVSSFSNSVKSNKTDTFKFSPNGLVDMLSNALFNSGCYSVLERKNMNEIIAEQDFSNSSNADSKTKVKLGKLIGASILIMGNVTEFQENTSGVGIGGVIGGKIGGRIAGVIGGVGKVDAHLGMIIKLIDTKTGMLLDSKSFERKVSKVGAIGGGLAGGVPMVAGGWKSKAMQDAAEELIIDIVEYISKTKTLMQNTNTLKNESSTKNGDTKQVVISVNNVSFEQLQKIIKTLSDNKKNTNIQKTFKNKAATITIETIFETDKIAEAIIDCKCGIAFEIVSLEDDKIEINVL